MFRGILIEVVTKEKKDIRILICDRVPDVFLGVVVTRSATEGHLDFCFLILCWGSAEFGIPDRNFTLAIGEGVSVSSEWGEPIDSNFYSEVVDDGCLGRDGRHDFGRGILDCELKGFGLRSSQPDNDGLVCHRTQHGTAEEAQTMLFYKLLEVRVVIGLGKRALDILPV